MGLLACRSLKCLLNISAPPLNARRETIDQVLAAGEAAFDSPAGLAAVCKGLGCLPGACLPFSKYPASGSSDCGHALRRPFASCHAKGHCFSPHTPAAPSPPAGVPARLQQLLSYPLLRDEARNVLFNLSASAPEVYLDLQGPEYGQPASGSGTAGGDESRSVAAAGSAVTARAAAAAAVAAAAEVALLAAHWKQQRQRRGSTWQHWTCPRPPSMWRMRCLP